MRPTHSGWIMTVSGTVFYPMAPTVDAINIQDIAHALGAVNRFNGHTSVPYSVAQHSVLVSKCFESWGPDARLAALLHDASEAYLCDVPRPLKQLPAFEPYRLAEDRLQQVIHAAFGLTEIANDPAFIAELKRVDRRMLRTEQAHLMPPAAPNEGRDDVPIFEDLAIEPWSARAASLSFMVRFMSIKAQLIHTTLERGRS